MALVQCPECGKEISSLATACPHCGLPNPTAKSAAAGPSPAPAGAAPSPRSFFDRTLLTGESVVFRTRLHWCHFLKLGFATLFLLGAAVACFSLGADSRPAAQYIGLACLVGSAGTASAIALLYMTSEFAVTNKRVMIKTGFIHRTSYELLLKQVEGIMVEQGLGGRLLNYGTVIISGTGGSKEDFDHISHPLEFRQHVQSQIASL